MTDIRAAWAARGCRIDGEDDAERVMDGGTPAEELAAASTSCVLFDASRQTRLFGDGPDLLSLLQRLSTGDVANLADGDGRSTVLTTAKGRIVERLFVLALGDGRRLLLGGPAAESRTLDHLKKYTFAEQTGLRSVTGETSQFALLGPTTADVLDHLDLQRPEPNKSIVATFEGHELWLVGTDGETTDGISLIVPNEAAIALLDRLNEALTRAGGRLTGEDVIDVWRLERGIPVSGSELTDEHNPLEVGLWDAVSFSKGCYVGQEVVARLNTYDKVSRSLVKLRVDADVEIATPTPLQLDDKQVGEATRGRRHPSGGWIGLGLVKKRHEVGGRDLIVGDGITARTEIVETSLA